MKIVVADDDESFLDFLSTRLAHSGHDVSTAFNGEQGLKLAREGKPDLLILDIMMPRMNGFEACEAARADQALAGMKIIMLSAKGFDADRKYASKVGADAYLVKPFEYSELQEAIARITAPR